MGLFSAWADRARTVGSALLEVWRAELWSLRDDLALSGRRLRGGLILIGLAAGLVFWCLGLAVWVGVELLALRLERWQAGLVVLGVGSLVTAILAFVAIHRLRRIENPMEAVKRHGRDHAEWLQQSVVPGLLAEKSDPNEPPEDA